MRSFPLTNYDFFGYLSSGYVLIFTLDYVLSTGWILNSSLTATNGIFVAACAYGVGHMLAGCASAIIERRLVRRWLGTPSLHFFNAGSPPKLFKKIYPSYFEPLPIQTQTIILERSKEAKITSPGEAMFFLCFNFAKSDKHTYSRMSEFLNNYGLCRNLSFTSSICALILLMSLFKTHRWSDLWWVATATALSAGMLLRYLKFYRHYALEVFMAYAHAKPKKQPTRKVKNEGSDIRC